MTKKKSNDVNIATAEVVKKDSKIVNKNKKKHQEKTASSKIKEFINKPTPIIIALCILCVVQLAFLLRLNANNAIYIGELDQKDVQIANLHMFTNHDMNYFYASPALYLAEDKEIYNFEIGYFIEVNGKMKPFASRARELENPSSLKEIMEEMSAWNFFETSLQDYFFSEEVLNNLDKLHFIVKASMEAEDTEMETIIDYPVELNKITK